MQFIVGAGQGSAKIWMGCVQTGGGGGGELEIFSAR